MKKMLSQEAFAQVRAWVYRNARPLDMALWQAHFEHGPKEAVVRAVAAYQREDGGIGLGFDADNWNPEASPYNVQMAIRTLRQVGLADIEHPLYQGMLSFLLYTPYQDENGWFFTIPTNNAYPRGVWWTHKAEDNAVQGIGVTASLCGFILRYLDEGHALYPVAEAYTERLLETIHAKDKLGDMGLDGYCDLLADLRQAKAAARFDMPRFAQRLTALLTRSFTTDGENFLADPLGLIRSREDVLYAPNEAIVEAALDALIDTLPAEGVWGIPWTWYDDGKHPLEFAISENYWKATKAVEKLSTLRRFGRLHM